MGKKKKNKADPNLEPEATEQVIAWYTIDGPQCLRCSSHNPKRGSALFGIELEAECHECGRSVMDVFSDLYIELDAAWKAAEPPPIDYHKLYPSLMEKAT